jgi:hypothetical protein
MLPVSQHSGSTVTAASCSAVGTGNLQQQFSHAAVQLLGLVSCHVQLDSVAAHQRCTAAVAAAAAATPAAVAVLPLFTCLLRTLVPAAVSPRLEL